MGVVRERKVVCDVKNVPSNAESAVQSGYTTQDSEDEASGSQAMRVIRARGRLIADGVLNLAFNELITSRTGQRRVRRILNTRFLEALAEDAEPTLQIDSKSKFQMLMEETDDALEFLEAYERQQAENALNDKSLVEYISQIHPYLNIPRKIRLAINSRKNFQYELLKSIEVELNNRLNEEGGDGVFIYTPHTCYERLLVHAAAKFKGFHSETILSNDGKIVKVSRNTASAIAGHHSDHMDVLLCDYIICLRTEE